LVIAHRAGNDPARAREACRAGADLVELDVHLRRGRLEVRHRHRAGPLMWDSEGLGLSLRRHPELEEALEALEGRAEPMIDLKDGPRRLGEAALAAARRVLGPAPVTLSARRHGLLDPLRDAPGVRLVRSAASPRQVEGLRRLVAQGAAPWVSLRRDRLDRALVTELRRGAQVMTWPVEDARDAALLTGWGVNGLICDDLALVAALRPG
jgi:glycerophosphoryl diester phosphodiesterase